MEIEETIKIPNLLDWYLFEGINHRLWKAKSTQPRIHYEIEVYNDGFFHPKINKEELFRYGKTLVEAKQICQNLENSILGG